MQRVIGGIFFLLLPAMLYYFVFNGRMSVIYDASGYGDYITYIVIGGMLSVMSFSTLMNVGRCLIDEIREGTLDTFLLSPASRMSYFMGVYLEQFSRSAFEMLAILLFGLLIGARISIANIPLLFVIVIVSSLAFFSFSITISSLMVYTRDTYLIQNVIYMLMLCICGVVFPIENLPKGLQLLSNLFPLTPAISMFRVAESGGTGITVFTWYFIHIVALSISYLGIGYFSYRKMEQYLIENILS